MLDVAPAHEPLAPPEAVVEALAYGEQLGWHTGAQLFVAHEGIPVIDWATGHASPGTSISRHTSLPWACAAKAFVGVVVAQLVESGELSWDDRITAWMPEVAGELRDRITIRQLLTYTAGIPRLPSAASNRSGIIHELASSPLEYPPGSQCRYNGYTNFFVLDELLRRVDGSEISAIFSQRICSRIGILDDGTHASVADVTLYKTSVSPPQTIEWDRDGRTDNSSSSVRGPARDLGRFYMALLHPQGDGLLSPQTLDEMRKVSSRIPPSEGEEAWRSSGLGFETSLERVLPHCGRGTFGYDAGDLGWSFADPERDLVFVCLTNGVPRAMEAWGRTYDVSRAVYKTLDL